MDMTMTVSGNVSRYSFCRDGRDREKKTLARMAHNDFIVGRPLDGVHPDIAALIGLLGVLPWVAREMRVNFAVSRRFAESAKRALGVEISPVSDKIDPREHPEKFTVGIAYSGGADCTAAMAIMGKSARAYFLDRSTRPGEAWRGLYVKDAALHSLTELSSRGYAVRKVSTDLEFIREPVGFPHDLSNIIPALCFAEEDGLRGVGWGAIFESTYRVGSKQFRDYAKSPFFTQVSPLLEAVGLSIVNPVAGVSEVGTAMVNAASGFAEFAQSCMRGSVGAPCLNCWKCARKVMVDSALREEWPDDNQLSELLRNREAARRLQEDPIKHEIVVAFPVKRYIEGRVGENGIIKALYGKLYRHKVDFLTRHFSPAYELLPAGIRPVVEGGVQRYLGEMTPGEVDILRSWRISDYVDAEDRELAAAALCDELVAK